MKRRAWTSLLGILTLIIAAGMPLQADENASPADGKTKAGMCTMECPVNKHGDGAFLKEKLGLTDEQAKKFDAIRDAEKAEADPLRDKVRTLSRKLERQLSAKASDGEIKTTLDELRSIRDSLMSSVKKFRSRMDDVLTPTQQARLLVSDSERMERHHWKHKG